MEQMAPMTDEERFLEAENYCLQANFILAELQANLQVYGSNSALTGANPANIDLALQYIDRSLEYFPDSVNYLNLKALLLAEGKKKKAEAIALLEKAALLNPRDINVQNNLKAIKSSACFVATAVYGRDTGHELETLRYWRDNSLSKGAFGRALIWNYYRFGPTLAAALEGKTRTVNTIRLGLNTFVGFLERARNRH